jgi:adenosine deaminase
VSIDEYLRLAPKAELHVHLEGAIQPATLLQLAQRNNVEIPATTAGEVRDWFVYRDFDHFIEIFVSVCRCLKTAEDYELIVYELGAEMARQNVRYAEVTVTPSTHHILGVQHDTYFSGLTRGRSRVWSELGVEINWIFNIVRQWQDPTRTAPLAEYVTDVAIDGRDDGVVALGLAGAENSAPPEPFQAWFDRARAAGLHSAPHAGEMMGPDSIWGAIRILGAERIGHGVRAIEDPALVRFLAEHSIPLEVCPTSNIRLGVYPTLKAHPIRALYEAGVSLTVNSDDPPLFNTTLNQELVLLHEPLGFDIDAIDDILLNGVRHSFMDMTRKQEQEAAALLVLAQLKRDILLAS